MPKSAPCGGRGHTVIGFGNPLRDLAGDAAYLAEFLRTLSGPIVLVGHSYGGNVIFAAAIDNDQVKALVYFNGWMCGVGESQQLLLEKFEGSLVGLRSGRSRLPTRTAARAPTSRPRGIPRGLRSRCRS